MAARVEVGTDRADQEPSVDSFEWARARSPVLALRVDGSPQLRVLAVQGPCAELLGVQAEVLTAGAGHRYAGSIDARDRERVVSQLLAVADSGAAHTAPALLEHELRLARPGSSAAPRWVSQQAGVVRDAGGKLVGFELLLQDISARKQLERAEALRRRQRQVIIELATHPDTAEGRFSSLCAGVTERLVEVCDVARASVWLLSAARDELVLVDLYARADATHEREGRLRARDYPEYFGALERGLTIDATDAARDPRTREFASGYLARFDIHSMLDAALLVAGEVAGVVCLEETGAGRVWAQHELEFATEVAAQLAIALHNRSFREARARERALQDQLLHSQKMEALGRLAGGVAHDFNNQLMVISASAQLLAGELEDPALRTYAEHIVAAGLRAGELTEQLQAFSRRQPLERHPLELGALMAKLEPLLRRVLGRGVELNFSLPSAPVWTRASEGLVQQLLTSLVDNARDAVRKDPRDPGQVWISLELAELHEPLVVLGRPVEAGRYALVIVADDGEGMQPEIEAQVFEPFYTTKPEGTGLGLATAYNITQRLEGSIKLASELGKGTRFYVFLPALELDEPARVTASD